jgi:hypothetical protein
MRSVSRVRLRLVAASVAAATVMATGIVSAPPAGAAARRSHYYELSAKPFVLVKSPDLLCDFNHPSWCAGANLKADPGAEIEIAAAAITLIGAVVTIIKGAIYVWFKWLRRYKGKHEGHLVGTCLTQSGGNVIWGKCGTGTTGAVATSRMWEVVPTLNNAIEYVNYYWQNKGQVLFLTEPQKITANGHLRLHALFPGSGGQQSQEWKLEYK